MLVFLSGEPVAGSSETTASQKAKTSLIAVSGLVHMAIGQLLFLPFSSPEQW